MQKLKKVFYDQLQEHYSSRKYKEMITLNCAKSCLTEFRGDDLTRSENRCLTNCFHKTYRYLNYSNMLYQFLTANEEQDKSIMESAGFGDDDENENEEYAQMRQVAMMKGQANMMEKNPLQ